jgi:3-deoxy-D-manno-octulosonate 8-phosphate phosphatase (KDO 8-P phosphatase)
MGDSAPSQAASTLLLVLDADGVLTDGSLLYGPSGEVLQRFDVHDGYGIRCLKDAGVEVAILTGRSSSAVAQRAKTLGIARLVQGAGDKAAALRGLASECGAELGEVCYVGDDVFDMPPMRLAGWSAAPANARAEVKAAATYVCAARGGAGAVREVAELILRARGLWPPIGTTSPAARS